MLKTAAAALLTALALASPLTAGALTIYPIDRAQILAGSRFDVKVEFDGVLAPSQASVTVNGQDVSAALGKRAEFVEREAGQSASAVILRDVAVTAPGRYAVTASDGTNSKTVTWEVFATGSRRARNVILFIGDGMSLAHRTAARILSKGIAEGKYGGTLAMDAMPHMALIGTSGVDSVITDSANSMSAYTTGHKSSVNALGVYADRTADTLDDPKVETITSLVKKRLGMAVGIVTNTEVEDATPAAMVAHTRRRSDYDPIVDMLYQSGAEVIMGGGSAHFLPKSAKGSKRNDDVDYMAKFRDAGYQIAATAGQMQKASADPATAKLLGLFHPGNMDGALDRKFLKRGTVGEFPEQPDLVEMVQAALAVLSRHSGGFVLMVESGLIDKFSHPLDWERAVMDTIMLDRAVDAAKAFAAPRGDTLILVTADHSHGLSIVGTVDDDAKGDEPRDKVGIYERAGYPNYPPPDAEGYPARLDVSRRLAVFFADYPDHYDTSRPKLDGLFVPAVPGPERTFVANPQYRDVPGSTLRVGNLPRSSNSGVHTAEDVILTGTGPGSELVSGFIDNTDLFRIMAEALGLGSRDAMTSSR